jgi:hypothetical protein
MLRLARSIPIGLALFLGVATAQAEDPPARVGRLSLVEGEVTFEDTRAGGSEPATLNWPVTGGAAIVTARGARAEVRIGATAIRLAGATDLEFVQLDDQGILLRLREGTVSVRVRDRETARQLTLDTPHARALLLDAGRFRFDASPRAGTSTMTAFQGSAQVTVGGAAVSVSSGRRAEVDADGGLEIVGAFADGFDDWALARDRGDDLAHSTRYVSPEMTGYESLDQYGDWRDTPDYGAVWYPRAVPVGWAPYRSGRWAWVEPWGWTWVDDAPWGFAPFHYGRWALIGGAWAWAPGVFVARPVYAPALVGWIGHPGWSVTVSIGAVPAVGWFPLAPREVFVPAYRCSTVYVRNINVTHVTTIVRAPRPHYAYQRVDRAVTVVPTSAVTHGRPVARSLVHARHGDLTDPASNAPPATVARPPQRFTGGARAREDARPPRRPADIARPAPDRAAPPASAATTARGERRADGSPRDDRDGRREPAQRLAQPPAVERAAPQQGRPEFRAAERPVLRAPAVAQPLPNAPGPAAPRAPAVAQPSPNAPVLVAPRASGRPAEQRPPAVQRDAPARADRAPLIPEQSRRAEPPRQRVERRPEPSRVERPVGELRAQQPGAQVAAPAPAPAVRAAPPSPQVELPRFPVPQPGAARGDGGRGERRGAERGGGERRGVERR